MAATVSNSALVDPPPPYEEHDTGVPLGEPSAHLLVKQRDEATLTEPSDYAMAYKAMQHNRQLPPG